MLNIKAITISWPEEFVIFSQDFVKRWLHSLQPKVFKSSRCFKEDIPSKIISTESRYLGNLLKIHLYLYLYLYLHLPISISLSISISCLLFLFIKGVLGSTQTCKNYMDVKWVRNWRGRGEKAEQREKVREDWHQDKHPEHLSGVIIRSPLNAPASKTRSEIRWMGRLQRPKW